MKKTIKMRKIVGNFAENKEIAKELRVDIVLPTLLQEGEVVFDFSDVDGATQSFIHALISEPIREFRDTAFEKLYYKDANEKIKKIVTIVYRYMQESLEAEVS